VTNIVLIMDDLSSFRATERMRADFVANAIRTPRLWPRSPAIETLQGSAATTRSRSASGDQA
jgi:hypothetical protein